MKKYLIPLTASVLLVSCSDADSVVTVDPVVTMDPVATVAPEAPALTLSFIPTKAFHFEWAAVPGATSYKLKEDTTTGSGYEVIETTTATATSFDHIVPLYARLNAKYVLESCNAIGCTASAEVFTSARVTEMVDSIGYIKASNTSAGNKRNTGEGDYFGTSVSLSEDGNTLAVGAINSGGYYKVRANKKDGSSTGTVYVFTRINNTSAVWSQQAYLKASNADSHDRFGQSVSLSADGNTLAVGASSEESDGTGPANNLALKAGAAYVFTRSDAETGAVWSEQAYLKASHADAYDGFGISVSLSADGTILAVGAFGEDSSATGVGVVKDNNDLSNAGAVYVFTRSGAGSVVWSEQAYLKASNAGENDQFGSNVSLSADGSTLVVSAYREKSNSQVINMGQDDDSVLLYGAGAAYVFIRTGKSWSQQAYLKASNTPPYIRGVDGDQFGFSVSVSADGNTVAVGARREGSGSTGFNGDQDNNDAPGSGAVFVFIRTGKSWYQQAYLKASNPGLHHFSDHQFGSSVSLSADGNSLAVGAVRESSNATGINGDQTTYSNPSSGYSGAVYAFARSGATWSQQAYIKASNTNRGAKFGHSVALSADGDTLAVGAQSEDSNAIGVNGDQENTDAENAGAVYVY